MLTQNIDLCLRNRELVAQLIAGVLSMHDGDNEIQFHQALKRAMTKRLVFHESGWYDPPPGGIGVLFADKNDDYERSEFPTLRTEPYWPSKDYTLSPETVGMVYASPIDKSTGLICDIGFNFYRGSDTKVQAHLSNCLETVEEIADVAKVGMSFNELHATAQTILDKRGVHNDWMVTYNDPTRGANFGHTFPWTFEEPTSEEKIVIASGDFVKLKNIIETKRLFVNAIEDFVIPKTIAFSIEARLGSNYTPEMPGGYFYMLVTFREGQKKIVSNLNHIFDKLNISYMRSRY